MAHPGRIARRAGANLSHAARRVAARVALPRGPGVWLVVRVGPWLDELPVPRLPWAGEPAQSLLTLLQTLESAAADPRIEGVLLRISGPPIGWSRMLSLRRGVERLRAAGKPVAAWSESYDAASLVLASAASRVWLPESGSVVLVGLRLDAFYLRGLLERLDVAPEVVRIGSHKTAGERFTREGMSPEEREQLEALADDLYAEIVEGIARGRGLSPDEVRERIDAGPYHARAALEAGLVDGCCYPDEIEQQLAALSAPSPRGRDGVQLTEGSAYHALRGGDPGWRPLLRGLPHIAYVVARGAIHRGASPRGIACDRTRFLLERVRKQDEVRGLVLRLDTPGGDGVASDLLWRAVSVVKRDKPVVVSMGDVVASGGYYVASAADSVYAENATLTGSIGVVGGKANLEGLYRRLGVGREAVERGARAGLLSEARGFTADERAALRGAMSALYSTFVQRVATGRGLEPAAVERAAQGRVWSGARARSLGLVDAIGGPLEALLEARRRAGLRDDERVVVDVWPRRPRLPGLASLLRLLPGPGVTL
jgi:protease-4